LFKNNDLKMSISARGGLEPRFSVLLSAIFQGLPWGISIRVENDGIGRKQKRGILWSIYVQKFYVFCISLISQGDVKNPSMTQFEAGMTYLRIRAARLVPAGLLKALMHPSI
jgi:hypothetical protein